MTKVVSGRATKLSNYLGKFSRANNRGFTGDYIDADLKNAFDFINNEFGGDYDPYEDYSNFRYSDYTDDAYDDYKPTKSGYFKKSKKDDDLSYSVEHGEQQLPVFSREGNTGRVRDNYERDREITRDVRYQTDEGRNFQESSKEKYERTNERLRERESE